VTEVAPIGASPGLARRVFTAYVRDGTPPRGDGRHLKRSSVVAFVAVLAACGSSKPAEPGSPIDAAAPPVDVFVAPSGPALPVGPVGHSGRWLTDALGRVLLPHGVNLVNKTAPYYPAAEGFSEPDAAWLAENGFRVVRVGILATGLLPAEGTVDLDYIHHVEATVDLLGRHGIFSLIDFHQDGWGPEVGSDGFPSWMTLTGDAPNEPASFPLYYLQNPALQQAFQSFWDDARVPGGQALQDYYAAMWSAVAGVFAKNESVLGYDLFNEPWPGTTYGPCTNASGCASLDRGELGPAYAKAVKAIRAAGDRHVVFGEPFVLFNYGSSATHMPLPGGDSNTGMSFHVYPLIESQAPVGLEYAVSWSSETGGALLNTEWGATTDTTTVAQEAAAFDARLMPWIFWSFCCEVVASFSEPPTGKNLVAGVAAALVRPYPLAVAGTPERLSFDPTNRTLSFTWFTARAGGGTLPLGTQTTFEVPSLVYPHGYTVTASHGSVSSKRCSPLLTVEADRGATSVEVTVVPGGKCE
jgi:endoglycosylceramidase